MKTLLIGFLAGVILAGALFIPLATTPVDAEQTLYNVCFLTIDIDGEDTLPPGCD